MPEYPKLTPRLRMIAEQVEALKSGAPYIAADIGTDHAKLPVFLVKTGICSFVYAGDVRPGPLASAEKTLALYRCGKERIRPVLSDGLQNIPCDYHTGIIAGMGGELIVNILSAAKLPENVGFVLSPMTAAEELRRYLYENGFSMLSENVSLEGRRIYPVITVKKTGINTAYTFRDLYCSPALLKNQKDPAVALYIKKCLASQQKIVDGKRKAGLPDTEYETALGLCHAFEELLNSGRYNRKDD